MWRFGCCGQLPGCAHDPGVPTVAPGRVHCTVRAGGEAGQGTGTGAGGYDWMGWHEGQGRCEPPQGDELRSDEAVRGSQRADCRGRRLTPDRGRRGSEHECGCTAVAKVLEAVRQTT